MNLTDYKSILLAGLLLALSACGDDNDELPTIVENGEANIALEKGSSTTTYNTPFNLAVVLSENGFLTITHVIESSPEHSLIISYFGDFGEVSEGQTLRSAFNDNLGFTYTNPTENISATGISVVLHLSTLDRDTNTISGHYDFSGTDVNATVEEIASGEANVSGTGSFTDIQFRID